MIAKEISRGITHIEDLPLSEFIEILTKLHNCEFTEKVDGAQLLFGLDENGFYTSRESKGGKRMYAEDSYPIEFSTTYMRSAHKLLEMVLPLMKGAGLRPGDQVEVEVLYGHLPNVVPYSKDRNYLIFLRTTEGDVNIDRLEEELSGQSLSITLESPFTEDGKSIFLENKTDFWSFARVPKMNYFPIWKFREENKVLANKLSSYMLEDSGISGQKNIIIESTPLNKCPEWCEPQDWKFVKNLVKEKKEEIRKTCNERLVPEIKNSLLDRLVRSKESHFGPLKENGGWIEGLVIRDPGTGKRIKLVDKDVFGRIREAAWEKRDQLTEHARSIDNIPSFMADVYIGMSTALGHPILGTTQAKSHLRKIGSTDEERIQNLTENVNFPSVKNYLINFLEIKKSQLLEDLDKYETKMSTVVSGNSLENEVYKRTLQTYATIFQKLNEFENKISDALDEKMLALVIVEKHLREL